MKLSSRLSLKSVLAPLLAVSVLVPSLSRADIAIVIEEFSDKIVVRYSGSLNTTTFMSNASSWTSELDPSAAQIYFSDVSLSPPNSFQTVVGDPVTGNAPVFGTGSDIAGGVLSGNYFVITNTTLAYPNGYVSGSALAGSLTFKGATMESLGINRTLAPGYAWSLSNGEEVTLDVLTGIEKAEMLLQQNAAKKAALLTAIRKLNRDLSAAIRTGKVTKLRRSVRNLLKQIAAL